MVMSELLSFYSCRVSIVRLIDGAKMVSKRPGLGTNQITQFFRLHNYGPKANPQDLPGSRFQIGRRERHLHRAVRLLLKPLPARPVVERGRRRVWPEAQPRSNRRLEK